MGRNQFDQNRRNVLAGIGGGAAALSMLSISGSARAQAEPGDAIIDFNPHSAREVRLFNKQFRSVDETAREEILAELSRKQLRALDDSNRIGRVVQVQKAKQGGVQQIVGMNSRTTDRGRKVAGEWGWDR